jgi:Rab-GTPase-TBC domain
MMRSTSSSSDLPLAPTEGPPSTPKPPAASIASLASRRSVRWRRHLGLAVDEASVEHRRHRFDELRQEHPYPSTAATTDQQLQEGGAGEDQEKCDGGNGTDSKSNPLLLVDDATASSTSSLQLDPLTAMVREEERKNKSLAELDLQYRKERARRKRSSSNNNTTVVVSEDESYDRDAAALEIIDKDLERLHTNQDKALLRSVLYVYHCAHSPDPGYRQGMHEVAGYLLRAMEEDEEDEAVTSNSSADISKGGSNFLASEVYAMLDVILADIAPSYDVSSDRDRKPLEAMGLRIMAMVGKADPQLWDRLYNVHVPPAIYLTKWIRLLFGREVQHVLELWDVIFELAQRSTNESSSTTPTFSVLSVLEAVAAARLLHRRREIVLGDDPLHFLMNVPVEPDLVPIVELVRPLLAGQAISMPPILLVAPPPPAATASAMSGSSTGPRGSPTASLRSSLRSFTASSSATPSGANATATTTTPALATAFSSMRQQFTEALDKTSSISKRLYHEWENLAADNKAFDDPLRRSYDDDIWHHAAPISTASALAGQANSSGALASTGPIPRTAVASADNPLAGPAQFATHSSYGSSPSSSASAYAGASPQFVAAEMELHVAALQNYCMNAQRVHRDVPPAVWESLAQLERLRQALLLLAVPSSLPPSHHHPSPPPSGP